MRPAVEKKITIGRTDRIIGLLPANCYIFGYKDNTFTSGDTLLTFDPNSNNYTNLEADISSYEYVEIYLRTHQDYGCWLYLYDVRIT